MPILPSKSEHPLHVSSGRNLLARDTQYNILVPHKIQKNCISQHIFDCY